MSTNKKRLELAKAYPSPLWQEQVLKMPDAQVIAIYLRFQRDGWPKIEPKLNPDLKSEDPPKPDNQNEDQIRLF